MSRTIEIPCDIGDKVYSKVGDEIREMEICDIAVYVLSTSTTVRIRAFVDAPDPFYHDGRPMRKYKDVSIGELKLGYEPGFLTREEAEDYYEKFTF